MKPAFVFRFGIVLTAALIIALFMTGTDSIAAQAKKAKPVKQVTFQTPEEGVTILLNASRAKDAKAMLAIFGPQSKDIVTSGDAIADRDLFERFVAAYDEKNRLDVSTDSKALLYVGNNEWPFPIPLVKKGDRWAFDITQGKEEILRRRIGGNELSTVETCLAYVDAQKEYAAITGKAGTPEYARVFASDPGKRNGLYWETKEGEEPSPMGVFMARAKKEGYVKKGDKPIPYHGYYYRIMEAQGKDAQGGAKKYVTNGKMTGGFALVAYPAQYGVSGIMTFIVNQDGVVYEKNLGKGTAKTAPAMKAFNPDSSWKQVR